MIETKLLANFLVIAEENSISKAAQRLHLSQPTLSKQLMALEEELGVCLFERGKKIYTLTDKGEYLKSNAKTIIEMVEKTSRDIKQNDFELKGDFHIGICETSDFSKLLQLIPYDKENGNICLHVFHGDVDTCLERLRNGLDDASLILGPLHDEKLSFYKLPYKETYGLLVEKNSPLAKKESIDINELRTIPTILPYQVYQNHQKVFIETPISKVDLIDSQREHYNIVSTYTSSINLPFLVSNGYGNAWVLESIGKYYTQYREDLAYVPITPTLSLDLYFVTRSMETLSPLSKIVVKSIIDNVSSIYEAD